MASVLCQHFKITQPVSEVLGIQTDLQRQVKMAPFDGWKTLLH